MWGRNFFVDAPYFYVFSLGDIYKVDQYRKKVLWKPLKIAHLAYT